MFHRCFIGLGSNMQKPEVQISLAIHALRNSGIRICAISKIHKTKAWGIENQPDFANAVIEIETFLPPEDLLELLQRIELEMGRIRSIKWGPRIIDLDILLYGAMEMDTPKLKIPHPYMWERDFVTIPLAEIQLS